MTMPVSVLIADDHELIRDALSMHLSVEPGINLLAAVASGDEILSLLQEQSVDVLVMDFDMPGSGLAFVEMLKREYVQMRIIVITGIARQDVLRNLENSPADLVLPKGGKSRDLIEAIKRVFLRPGRRRSGAVKTLPALSRKENEVLRLIADGHSNARIAERLALSPKTVDTHRQNIMKKLAVHSAPELIRKAMQLGLIV